MDIASRTSTPCFTLAALVLICGSLAVGCGGDDASDSARPVTGVRQVVASLPWQGRLPSGETVRIHARGDASPIDCIDVRTGAYDSSDYCVTDSRDELLNASTQLDCGTGDAMLVGSLANDGLRLQLQPQQGRTRNATRFDGRTITASRRVVFLSFAATQLPARLLLVGPGDKVLETHHIGSQVKRCGGDDSRLLFGWL